MTSPFGRLQHFLDDSEIQEIMIIAGKHLWVEDASGIHFIEDLSTSDVAMVLEATRQQELGCLVGAGRC